MTRSSASSLPSTTARDTSRSASRACSVRPTANWDLTIVDNASTDATPEIVERFAAKDSRIRLSRFEEFVSANDNHNRAFRAISPDSEYCKVVQADDWLYPECLTRMIAVAETTPSIGIVSAYRLSGDQVDLVGLPYRKTVFSGREILALSLLQHVHVTGAPTALLYRSSVVRDRDPFWASGYEHADTEAAYRVLTGNDFGFVHQVLTFARAQQPGSRMAEWASALSTYIPENIRFLIRYGPDALDDGTYRRQLRLELRKYVWFHTRQLPKPSRIRDPRFFAVHRSEIEAILAESGGDAAVRSAMCSSRRCSSAAADPSSSSLHSPDHGSAWPRNLTTWLVQVWTRGGELVWLPRIRSRPWRIT